MKVVCQDARLFRLADFESAASSDMVTRSARGGYSTENAHTSGGADLITMSYSLSMIVRISKLI